MNPKYKEERKKYLEDNFISESAVEEDEDGREFYVIYGNNGEGSGRIVYLDEMGIEK